jgi:putative transcriptional regulator
MMATASPGLFDRLKQGLEDGIGHERGTRKLRTTEVVVPEPPRAYTADDVRQLRTRLNLSQLGFARLLQVSNKTVQSWEQGVRRPQQSSARLLQFIQHPEMLAGLSKTD